VHRASGWFSVLSAHGILNVFHASSLQVINDPNVITVQRELPRAQALLACIYQCDYKGYFQAVRTCATALCSVLCTAAM
jgi:hypothetical protein